MKKLLLIGFSFLLLIMGCDSSTAPVPEEYVVVSSSISNEETIGTNSGLIIKFNANLPESFFEADTIIKEIIHTDNTIIPYTVWEIKDSQSFLLNDEPQSFWYDPNNYTCAFFGYTTVVFPDGTGEGFNLGGGNQFSVGEIFAITIYGESSPSNVLEDIKAVPNPYLIESGFNETEHNKKIRFTRLPNECTITISNISGQIINTIIHNSAVDGNEWWDLTNLQSEPINSGIYSFQVVANENTFENGVLIINLD